MIFSGWCPGTGIHQSSDPSDVLFCGHEIADGSVWSHDLMMEL